MRDRHSLVGQWLARKYLTSWIAEQVELARDELEPVITALPLPAQRCLESRNFRRANKALFCATFAPVLAVAWADDLDEAADILGESMSVEALGAAWHATANQAASTLIASDFSVEEAHVLVAALSLEEARYVNDAGETDVAAPENGGGGDPGAVREELVRLEQLAADHPLWDSLDAFVEGLHDLGARKLDERRASAERAARRSRAAEEEAGGRLATALAAMSPAVEAQLRYLRRAFPLAPRRIDPERVDDLLLACQGLGARAEALGAARALQAETLDDEEVAQRARRAASEALLLALQDIEQQLDAARRGDDPSDSATSRRLEDPGSTRDAPRAAEDATASVAAPTHPMAPAAPGGDDGGDHQPSTNEAPESGTTAPAGAEATADPPPARAQPDSSQTPTAPEVAAARPSAPVPGEGDVVLRLLKTADDAGAYWAAWALEQLGSPPPVSSDVLASLQASRWVDPSRGLFVSDVSARVAKPARESWVERAIATAAALVPTLTSPATKLRGWMETNLDDSIDPIIAAVVAFADQTAQPLTPLLLEGAGDAQQRANQLARAQRRLREWSDSAPRRTTKYQPATRLWQTLFRLDFAPLCERAGRGEVDSALRGEVEDLVARLRASGGLASRLREVDRELRKGHAGEIAFGARDQLDLFTAQSLELLEEWSAVAREADQVKRLDWLTQRVAELQQAVGQHLERALEWAASLRLDGVLERAAAGATLHRSLMELGRLLHQPIADEPVETDTSAVLAELARQARSLDDALDARLLLCTPPEPRALGIDPASLLARVSAPPLDPSTAAEAWARAGRFAEVERMAGLLSDQARTRTDLERERWRQQTDRELSRALSTVEQGVIDGYVGAERAEFMDQLEALQLRDEPDFSARQAAVANVLRALEGLRSDRARQALEEWGRLSTELHTRGTPRGVVAAWDAVIRGAGNDVRILDERLSELRARMDQGQEIEPPTSAPAQGSAPLQEYREFCKMAESLGREMDWGHVLRRVRESGRIAPSVPPLTDGTRREAVGVIEAWIAASRPDGAKAEATAIGRALRFLGYALEGEPTGAGQPGRWRVRATDGGECPVPQFGSRARGEHTVVCLRGQVSGDALTRAVPEGSPVIVFCLERLTWAQRASVRAAARHKNLTMLCLDDSLLAFLMTRGEDRHAALFECALPFSHLNPYTPHGEVPPEMYFGRRALLDDLLRPEGRCIVYGGRQLGKSALLREVRRRFHDPARSRYALVVEVQTIGDPGAGQDVHEFWQVLRDRLREAGVLKTSQTKPRDIISSIRSHLNEHPQLRLTVLADEADHLLDADAKDGFQTVTALRELMSETDRRFRVVFAGLHNVQRFQQLPNQPLVHLGAAIQVGPLEPRDAADLVRRPTRALGFVFADDADVLRILSYTNYHPGLIQLYCHELVKLLQAEVVGSPPYEITRQHVDRVYRLPDVRRGILDRFDLTLALDPRYQALAWALIVERAGRSERSYAVRDLQEMVQVWWPKGFSRTSLEEFRGLLDEMVGLGVLVASPDGKFRLRSPNVAQLMGDVEPRLLELAEKEPPASFDVDRIHRHGPSGYSPLTLGQERSLLARQYGVALLFASRAQGHDAIVPSLRDLERHVVIEAPAGVSADELEHWLTEEQRRPSGLIVAVVRASAHGEATRALVERAHSYCTRRSTSKNVFVRVLFLFDEAATAGWTASMPRHGDLERRVELVLWPRLWGPVGLRARLQHKQVAWDDQAVERLRRASGGWTILVEEALQPPPPNVDAQVWFQARLEHVAAGPRRAQLLVDAGLGPGTRERQFFVALEDWVGPTGAEEQQITPDLFDPTGRLGDADIHRLLVQLERLGLIERAGGRVLVDAHAAASARERTD